MARLLSLAAALLLATPAVADTPAKLGAYTLQTGVTYATVDGKPLKLDLAVPTGPGPHPLVVCIHGGAWKYGHRDHLTHGFWWYDFGVEDKGLVEILAARGFATASVGYRLAPVRFPAQLTDTLTAIRFLRANAAKFRLDPDHFAALGLSAGGHIAALVGTVPEGSSFEGKLYPNVSSRVECVVDYYGATDLTLYAATPGLERAFMVPLFGCPAESDPEAYKQSSPLEYVSKDDPPFLILHGTADLIVPVVHSEKLLTKLKAAGVPVTMVTVPGGGHGWSGPAAADTTSAVVKFLTQHLKGK